MTTLYVDRKGLELEVEARTLTIREQGRLLRKLPLNLLERVIISTDVQLSCRLLTRLADDGVALAVLDVRRGGVAILTGKPGVEVRRRLGHYKLASDESAKAMWAAHFVRAKAIRQARLLRVQAKERPDRRGPLTAKADEIQIFVDKLGRRQPADLTVLRGIEGAASAAYFSGLGYLFPAGLGFHSRNRRPPRDPVNAVLSLSYTLLHQLAVQEICATGLDPFLGFLHEPAHGRESLACDLIEPLRPIADAVSLRLFRERILRGEHFSATGGACLLGKAGRQAYYAESERSREQMRLHLRRMARVLARAAAGAGHGADAAASDSRLEEMPDADALH